MGCPVQKFTVFICYRNIICGEVNNTMLCMLCKNLNSCHFMRLKCCCNSAMFMDVLRPFALTCSLSPILISDGVCIESHKIIEHFVRTCEEKVMLCFRIKTLKVLSDGAELITPHVQSWPNKTPISYSGIQVVIHPPASAFRCVILIGDRHSGLEEVWSNCARMETTA